MIFGASLFRTRVSSLDKEGGGGEIELSCIRPGELFLSQQ